MKKILSALVLICILSLALTGCGFLPDDSGRMIDQIKKTNEFADGSSEITITFVDDLYDPVVFTIPGGVKGDVGNGISDIKYDYDEENRQTKVTILFTDPEFDEVVFDVPDGKTITSIKTGFNTVTEKNEAYFVFNGNEEDFVTLELPEFSGISNYEYTVNDDQSIDLKFEFNLLDQPDLDIHIPAPETGNGISYMSSGEKDGKYIVTVYYTHADKDGKQVQELEFDKPADPNSWSLVDRSPTNAEGRDGDFWFDSFSKTIFSKSNGVWSPVINFNDQSTSYKVTFYLNYGDNTVPYTQAYINHGCYYSSTGKSIPIPTREGYVFAGWYTKAEDVNPVVNAPFTDLTPVNGTLDLYAKWDEEPATSE